MMLLFGGLGGLCLFRFSVVLLGFGGLGCGVFGFVVSWELVLWCWCNMRFACVLVFDCVVRLWILVWW